MTTVEQPSGDVTEARTGAPWALIGGGAAALVLIGGGAFAAMNFLGGGGDQPSSVLPDTTAAYLALDLDPSVGEKIAAVRFFQGLDPEVKDRLDAGQWREWVWEQIEKESDAPLDVTFEEDIKPWLGDRAGLAAIPNGTEDPIVAVALQVKDGDAALASLEKMQSEAAEEELGYYLEGDYVVFSLSEHVDQIKAATEAGALNNHDAFTETMDDLGDLGVASFWADLERMEEIGTNAAVEMSEATDLPVGVDADAFEQLEAMAKGRVAGTVRLAPDAIEVHGIQRGFEGLGDFSGDSAHVIQSLPADTGAAFGMEHGSTMVQAGWDYLSELMPQDIAEMEELASQEGFTLPDDLMTILGTSMAVGVGGDIVEAVESASATDSGMPQLPISVRIETDTNEAQRLLVDTGLASFIAQRADDGILTAGLDQTYIDGIATGSVDTLGDDPTFQSAVPNADDANMLLYVNVNYFEQYYLPEVTDQQVRDGLEALAAIGMSSGFDNETDGHFTVRLVADSQ